MTINLKRLEKYLKEDFEGYVTDIEYIEDHFFTFSIWGLESNDYEFFDIHISVSSFGTYEFKVVFGFIEKTFHNYELINHFNDKTTFKAYISSDDLLPRLNVVIRDMDLKTNSEIIEFINFHFELLLTDEDFKKHLLPATSATIDPV